MIKALLLIFEPAMTWEKIVQSRKSLGSVLLLYLTPMIVLSLAGELAGLAYFGKAQEYLGGPKEFGGSLKISRSLLITYGIAQFISSYLLVAISARIMMSIAQTFHSRHTYSQCFTVTAYGFGPLFLLRLCDAFPSMNPWASFGIGIVLTITTLYQGVPKVLEPDPPNAFGLYLSSAFLLTIVSALTRYLTLLVLQQKFHL